MNTVLRMLLFVILCVAGVIAGEKGKDSARIELKEISTGNRQTKDNSSPFDQVRIFLETDRMQTESDNGLEFVVDISNESQEAIELFDPTEFEIQLVDLASGYRVELPPTPHASSINTKDPEGTKALLDLTRSYQIVKPTANNATPDLKTINDIKNRRIVLAAGQHLIFTARVKNIIADAKAYWEQHKPTVTTEGDRLVISGPEPSPIKPDAKPMVPGKYEFSVMLGICSTQQNVGGRILQSEKVVVDWGCIPDGRSQDSMDGKQVSLRGTSERSSNLN